MPVLNGYTYTIVGSDCTITAYDPATSSQGYNPDIPSTLDGYNVTIIAASAFASKSLVSLNISIPVALNNYSFAYNTGIAVTLDANVSTTGVTSPSYSPFLNCALANNLTITSNVTTIPARLFGNSGLTALSLPSSVTVIDDYAFYSCSIASLTLDHAMDLGDECFKEPISNLHPPQTDQ